jgi:transposase
MKVLSPPVKYQIKNLISEGHSVRHIAASVGVSKSTVSRLRTELPQKKKTLVIGRPRLLSRRQESTIARFLTTGKIVTAVDAKKYLDSNELASVSSSTIQRSLRRNGLRSRIRRKVPLLRATHRRKRLEFALEHKDWSIDDFRKVIWSDESKINVFGSDGRKYCWKRPGDKPREHHFLSTVKHGGGTIFLWGCMTTKGVGHLARIDGGLDSKLYKKILKGELLDTLKYYGFEKAEIIFQHDNDPKHTSKKIQRWLRRSDLNVMRWPSQSPDLNPIEHLWAELKRRIQNRRQSPSNKKELWEAIEEEWESIPSDFCNKLIDTMPARIYDVIKAKGGHTSW